MLHQLAAVSAFVEMRGTTPQQLLYEEAVLRNLLEQHILIDLPRVMPDGPATVILPSLSGSSVALAVGSNQALSFQATPTDAPAYVSHRAAADLCNAQACYPLSCVATSASCLAAFLCSAIDVC